MRSERSPSMPFRTSPLSSSRSSPKCRDCPRQRSNDFVTFPLELQLTGAPGLTDIRSLSKVGLSMITVVFRGRCRYLSGASGRARACLGSAGTACRPEHFAIRAQYDRVSAKSISSIWRGRTITTRLRCITETDLMERRTLEDWVIRPLLKGLPDVVDVNSHRRVRQAVPGAWSSPGCCGNTTWPFTMSSTPSRRIMPMPAAISLKKDPKNTSSAASA